MRSSFAIILALSTAALLACGGSQPAPAASPASEPAAVDANSEVPAAPEAGAGEAAPEAAEAPEFDDLTKDQKIDIMMSKVVPNVGKLFKEHDPKTFGKFGCATCHGPQKKAEPHDVLPKLTLSNGGMEKLSKAKPEMVKFMAEKVVPEMAAALGEKPYDPATKQGFGCAGCHKVD